MIQLDNFPSFAAAAQTKFPAYASRIRALYDRRVATFGAALDAGVPIYAGTDAGGYLPHGIVGREIAALGTFMSPEQAADYVACFSEPEVRRGFLAEVDAVMASQIEAEPA